MTSKVGSYIVRELCAMLKATEGLCKPRVLVALSGGKDSVGLLATLGGAEEHGRAYVLYAGYVNHAVQEVVDQQREFKTVHAVCASEFIPLYALSLYGMNSRAPISETYLRQRRYKALFAMAQSCGARYIVTAHHRDDLCESVLMRLFSHGAWQGLGSIPSMRRIRCGHEDIVVLRPALHAQSKLFHAPHLLYHEDTSNSDTHYTRNALRHEVIPFIKRHFPHSAARVEAISSQVTQLRTLVEAITPPWLIGYGYLAYSFDSFKALSRTQQDHVLFQGANAFGIRQISHGFLEQCRNSLLCDKSSIRIASTILMQCGHSMIWKSFEKDEKKVQNESKFIPKIISVHTCCSLFYTKDNVWVSGEDEKLQSDFGLSYKIPVAPPLCITFLKKSDSIVHGGKKLNVLSILDTSLQEWRDIPVLRDSEGIACVLGEVFLMRTLCRSYENERVIDDTIKLCTVTIKYHAMSVVIGFHPHPHII